MDDPWCNGNTTVFGTVIQGSSPCGSTKELFCKEGLFLYHSLKVDVAISDSEGSRSKSREDGSI